MLLSFVISNFSVTLCLTGVATDVREVCFTSLFIVHHDGGRYGGPSGSVHGHVSLHLPHILGSRCEAEAKNSGLKQGHTVNKAGRLCPLHPGSHFLSARPHLLKVPQLDDTAVPGVEQCSNRSLYGHLTLKPTLTWCRGWLPRWLFFFCGLTASGVFSVTPKTFFCDSLVDQLPTFVLHQFFFC